MVSARTSGQNSAGQYPAVYPASHEHGAEHGERVACPFPHGLGPCIGISEQALPDVESRPDASRFVGAFSGGVQHRAWRGVFSSHAD